MSHEINTVIQNNELILINFKSSSCDPCEMIKPTLQQVKNSIGKRVEIYTFEINQLPFKINHLQIDSLPLLALFANGKLIWKAREVLSKEEIIKKMLEIEP
jgi:thioredoxin 1